jgi:CheY-like chemotaxis protein
VSATATDFRLLSDQPDVGADDPLGFEAAAASLQELILSSLNSSPFTIGIEAGWGMGKSSMMRRLERQLTADPRVKTVWFNAWTAEGANVLEGLIKSVLDRIDENILRKVLRKKQLVSWTRAGVDILARLVGLHTTVNLFWDRTGIDPKTRNDLQSLLKGAMEQWMQKHSTEGTKSNIVVFIDDLDRCDPTNVFGVFEALKLYLDVPGFVFIIGFDSLVISDAVLEEKKFSKALTGRQYLEKIIQIGYRIPEPNDDEVVRLIEAYLGASQTASLFDLGARTLIAQRNNRNPRRLKRFINGFVLQYILDEEAAALGPELLAKVQILQMYFSEFVVLFPGGAKDPLEEFLGYAEVRTLMRQGQTDSRVERVLQEHKLRPTASLEELERELPESFPRLASNEEFVSLLSGLSQDERDELLVHLRRSGSTSRVGTGIDGSQSPDQEAPLLRSGELSGFEVLWLDDEPQDEEELYRMLQHGGANIRQVRSRGEAETALKQSQAWGILISDITRDGNTEAGFDDLESLRSNGLYSGPVLFFTTRLTPARRERAGELQALITSDVSEAVSTIRAIASRMTKTAAR